MIPEPTVITWRVPWDIAMHMANADAMKTGIRQQVSKTDAGDWLWSPIQ